MKTLRQSLFRSHLQVMFVAIVVTAVGASIVAVVFSVFEATPATGRRGNPALLLLPIGAAVAAAGFVSWIVTRRLMRPLEDVRQAAADLAGGKYGARVGPSDIEELRDLGESMNVLADSLERTEQRRLELIGDVAHELRNPLATIQASMEGLMDGVTSADDETFAMVSQQAARLSRLARDLADLSASNEWASRQGFEAIELTDLADEVVMHLGPQATAKGLTVSVDRMVPSAVVEGDRDRLTQVLINVVGNAIQYSDEGHIAITVDAEGSQVVLAVADSGRGLEADAQARIFERFYRVDRTYNDGTGVGLAIAKAIVDAHRGSIGASSPGLGKGTSVRIELPAHG